MSIYWSDLPPDTAGPGKRPSMRWHDLDRDDSSHYARLGLMPGATREEIKAAYRRRVMREHPDHVLEHRRAEAEERMKQLNASYSALMAQVEQVA